MSLKLTLAALASLLPLTACSSGPRAIRYDDVMAGKNKQTEVEIQGSVVKACSLPTSRAYFEYNSDGLDEYDKSIVTQLADCMNNGKLKGRSILVTGYTDASGDANYNKELGMTRSQAIAAQLYAEGVAPHHIYLRSRGERDAKAEYPDEMVLDRKVELRLLDDDS